MTREEAVIILDGFKNNPLFNDTHAQAFNMAISALSEMSDLISRETAIQTVHETIYQFIDDSETMTDRDRLLLKVNKAICNGLKEIPSAENKGKWKKTYLDHVAMGERPSILYCSVCCQCIAYPTNYCPNCGAKMKGGE